MEMCRIIVHRNHRNYERSSVARNIHFYGFSLYSRNFLRWPRAAILPRSGIFPFSRHAIITYHGCQFRIIHRRNNDVT